jgi:hypothetical protein
LEPPNGAVGTDDARLEADDVTSLRKLPQRLPRRLHVVRMRDVEDGLGEQHRLRKPQRPLERCVDPLEVAIETDDAQEVD